MALSIEVTVSLLSGREAALRVDGRKEVRHLLALAQRTLGRELSALVSASGVRLPLGALVGERLSGGDRLTAVVEAWAPGVFSTATAFTRLREDGSVVAWGHARAGATPRRRACSCGAACGTSTPPSTPSRL